MYVSYSKVMTAAEDISSILHSGNICSYVPAISSFLGARTDVVIHNNRESLKITDANGRSFIITGDDGNTQPLHCVGLPPTKVGEGVLVSVVQDSAPRLMAQKVDTIPGDYNSQSRVPSEIHSFSTSPLVGGYRDALSQQMLRWKSR